MMRRRLVLAAFSLAFAVRGEDRLCVSDEGVFHPPQGCVALRRGAVANTSARAQKFAIVSRNNDVLTIGILAPHRADAHDTVTVSLSLPPSVAHGTATEIAFTEATLGTWKVTLDRVDSGKTPLEVKLPPGTWDYVVKRQGRVVESRSGIKLRLDARAAAPGMIEIRGRAFAQDGVTPAAFAEVTADCKRVVCNTAADGTFRCDTALPPYMSFCIEHPLHGRRRLDLDQRTGKVNLGDVKLLSGATIRVMTPLHVLLPDTATVTLLRGKEKLSEPQALGARGVVEFPGLAAGRYDVLLAGSQPLQRKLFTIEVAGNGETELPLSVDAYRLTGEVEYRKKPLPNATVTLIGDAWDAELHADQSGRFDAELWSDGEYAVSVTAGDYDQPYNAMKRSSPSDSHWRLVVPSRRITGRVYDAESGRPIPSVSLLVGSDDGETRSQRPVPVNADGTFVYTGAGEGRFTLSAAAEGYQQGEPLHLQIGESDGDRKIELPLLRASQVQLLLVDANMQPVRGAAVLSEFSPNGALKRLMHSDNAGAATVTVPHNGQKTVYIVSKDTSLAVVRVSARDAENGMRVVVPPGVATLRVHTKTDADEPLPGVSLGIRYNGAELPLGVLSTIAREKKLAYVTDASGELTIPALPAGEYEIGWRQRGAVRPAGWMRVSLGAGETKITQTFARTGE